VVLVILSESVQKVYFPAYQISQLEKFPCCPLLFFTKIFYEIRNSFSKTKSKLKAISRHAVGEKSQSLQKF